MLASTVVIGVPMSPFRLCVELTKTRWMEYWVDQVYVNDRTDYQKLLLLII